MFACVGTLAGSKQMIEAWYRIIRELFTAGKPDWIIGGARAGEGGWVTAYSTTLCVQAICDLAEVLERTAELMVSVYRIQEQLVYRKNGTTLEQIHEAIPEKWIERDAKRLLADLSITINAMSHGTLLTLFDPAPDPDASSKADSKADAKKLLTYVDEEFPNIVDEALKGLESAFQNAKTSIESLRKGEKEAARRAKVEKALAREKRGDLDSNHDSRRFDESNTGHVIAMRAIKTGMEHNDEALDALHGPRGFNGSRKPDLCPGNDWMLKVADCLYSSARGVRSGADTCRGYLSSVIDRQILASEPTDNRSWEPDELSFALSAYILSTDAQKVSGELDRLRRGTKLICKDLSSDGTISNRIPFHAVESWQYYTNTEELLGAVSDVVRLTGYPIEEHVASSIYHYFDRQCLRNPRSETNKDEAAVAGFFSEFDHFRKAPDLKATIDAVESIGAFNRMLDEGINETILDHFNVRQPNPYGLMLDRLFYPDYGFEQVLNEGAEKSPRIERDSIALTMQKMRAQVLRVEGKTLNSIVLHGPGGTGKTTLIEALANTCKVPLVEVTPSDIVERGEANVERRARAVFEALSMLSKVVILFDEFDPILKRRDPEGKSGTSIYTFLTPGMLPKLKALNESAKHRRVAYALMTNLIGSLDVPAVRKGRFDEAVGIYPSDPLSRAGYIARLCIRYTKSKKDEPAWHLNNFSRRAFIDVVKGTAGVGMTSITAKGWFRLNDDSDLTAAPIGYILGHFVQEPDNTQPASDSEGTQVFRKLKFDEPEEKFTEKSGEGPLWERENLQWSWLTKWEDAWLSKGTPPDDYWKDWLRYLNEWPIKAS
jgi:hypothetical protein